MKILVDAMSARVGGGLSFLKEQLGALESGGAELELLTAPWNHDDLASSLRGRCRRVPVPNVMARFAFEQTVMPLAANADILYCPGNFIPLAACRTPRVLCVQNANYFGYGRRLQANLTRSRRIQVALSHASVRRAEATIVISHSLHREMTSDGLDSARVHVVRSGAPKWRELAEKPEVTIDRPFVLSLANDYPHKRLADAVAAWALARSRAGNSFPGLVLVGSVESPHRERLCDLVGRSADGLRFVGSVRSRGQIRWLLENCVAMISTSELEALPLVPIEAGILGTPAILTDIAPHREVADGYARFFGVGDVVALADRLAEAARVDGRRSPLAWPITWDENARQVLEVMGVAATHRDGRT